MSERVRKDVLAIVVTHNRLELLKRCIDYLNRQTVLPQILIIDNKSTDGTKEYLVANGIPHVTQENSGSAGGWWRGIAEGWERGYRYLWMMDDDGFPDSKALEVLLGHINKETVCISSIVVKENNPSELVFGMPRINKNGVPILFSTKRKYYLLSDLPVKDGKYPCAHLFNGALVDLEIAKEIGNIDRSYFMYGDEMDYYFRLWKRGRIYSAVDALHYHPDVSRRNIDKKKVYYFIRNSIIINHLYFNYAFIRDFLAAGVAMFRILKRNGIGQFFSYFFGSNKKFFFRGISDGIQRKRINRY